MDLWQQLSHDISQQTQTPFHIQFHTPVSGGCINSAHKVSNGKQAFFIKVNSLEYGDMFAAEALALEEMLQQPSVRVPRPICHGNTATQAYLVLEHLELIGHSHPTEFAQQLATMHRISQNQYGWVRDNTIGSTPQHNALTDNWVEFWREQRLLPQLALAEKNGYASTLFPLSDKLLGSFHHLFSNYIPTPSMLHGDLWGGNAAALADGTPVIFDPALYYGDRETDIAMTHLFGGFDNRFHTDYHEAWPLDHGFAVRKIFYNLYHILNHLNLFGSGYLDQAISMTKQVLAEV